ncbi:conserved protein of unknown function [Cupriavidus taiwanensis]|uniref:DUF2325 domain-containing protein n=1 Tax=Cupriavidus taiwanensis TaxID=164546 RepID=A0A375IJF3_9BURK|nr:DUF2325 domain-containing protein [Cupriavidus taiwanensis]SPK73689.1 conserved protein of unknown function [Cupriavidus taiwanensis]
MAAKPHAATNSARILWTDDEKKIVARESLRLKKIDSGLSDALALQNAQMLLPEERQRPSFKNWKSTASWLMPLWQEFAGVAHDGPQSNGRPVAVTVKRSKFANSIQQETEQTPAAVQPDATVAAVAKVAVAEVAQQAELLPADAESTGDSESVPTTGAEFRAAEESTESLPVQQQAEAETAAQKAAVRWTQEERERIARRSREIMIRADIPALDAVRAANIELDDDRQRDISTMSLVSEWLLPIWKQLDKQEQEARARAEREERERAEREAAEAERIATEARERQEAVDAAVAATFENASFDDLLKRLGQKIAGALMESISESLDAAVAARIASVVQSLPGTLPSNVAVLKPNAEVDGVGTVSVAPRDHKPRVCVVGLLNQQAEDVRRAFGDTLDFTFIKSQQSGGSGAHGGAGMAARAQGCDVVIGMTNFTGHDVDEAAKKLHVPFIRLNGSVSALKRWLQHWLNGEVALAS